MSDTEATGDYLVDKIEPPKDHLLAAERASDAGQASYASAVATTGDERTAHLNEAIVHAQNLKVEWTKYRAAALGLPGEELVARRYVADQDLAQATASALLVALIDSSAPGMLPPDEIASHAVVKADLVELHTMYRTADRAAFVSVDDEAERAHMLLFVGSAASTVLVIGAALIGFRRAKRSVVDRSRRREVAELGAFETRLRRALGLVDHDRAAFVVGERAMREMFPDNHSSLLVADSSRARLDPVSEAPVCGVTTPDACPALRTGSTVSFDDSDALDACPTLAANTDRRCSATCVPVSVAGRVSALLHLVGKVGEPPDRQGVPDVVARGVGDRVTLLQALATFQLQAERDPLTGLLNRRSLETAVEQLVAGGGDYAVAFGDLDHFKVLNDLHGHDAGDRALRAFSRTLRDSLRPQDISCRWGGEEFIIVLPGCDSPQAVEVMDRVRTNLALGSIAGLTTSVTVSFGVASSAGGENFDEIVERADAALREAKDGGRNRVVTYTGTLSDAV